MGLAGTQFGVSAGPAWRAAGPRHTWSKAAEKAFTEEEERNEYLAWDDEHGERRTELVCIGRDLDRDAARVQLDGCLLTSEEMAMGKEGWLKLDDPYTPWPHDKQDEQGRRAEAEAGQKRPRNAAVEGGKDESAPKTRAGDAAAQAAAAAVAAAAAAVAAASAAQRT